MIDRVFSRLQDEASVATMRIFQHPRAPVTRWNVRYRQVSMGASLSSTNPAASMISEKPRSDTRSETCVGRSVMIAGVIPRLRRLILLHNRPERWPMQMIEVRVRHEDQIDGRQVGNA